MSEKAAIWEDINVLVPWSDNPRHNQSAIQSVADSIKRFGFASPIIAREADKMIIAGHTRLAAAKSLGLDRVPVRYLDLDPADAKMLALADNKIGEIADWDEAALEKIIDDLSLSADDMADLGWNTSELDDLFESDFDAVDEEPVHVDEDSEPVSNLGEVYNLGNHILVCGDCTDRDNWPAKSDGLMLFTSPPYMATNSQLTGNTKMKTKYIHKEDQGNDFDSLMSGFTEIAIEVCGQVFVNTQILADNKKILLEYMYKNRDYFCDLLIWDKELAAPAIAENVCTSVFEIVIVLSKKNNSRSMIFADFRGTQSNIIQAPPNRMKEYSGIHSAVMGIDFCDKMISVFAEKADIVIDCFGGTGTTMIVCERHKKKSWLIEKSEIYCDLIRKRWFKYATEHNLDVGDGLDG